MPLNIDYKGFRIAKVYEVIDMREGRFSCVNHVYSAAEGKKCINEFLKEERLNAAKKTRN
jgi:hypothetical protein